KIRYFIWDRMVGSSGSGVLLPWQDRVCGIPEGDCCPMSFSTVFVAGAGFMGSGIAYLIATKTKSRVLLYDIYPTSLEKAQAAIEKMGNSSLDKGFIQPDQLAEATKRIKFTEDDKEAHDADLVIEAIAEDFKAKRELFAVLDKTCKPHVIFASNTS